MPDAGLPGERPAEGETAGQGAPVYRAEFPGRPESMAAVRAFVRAVAGSGVPADEAALAASELAACAVLGAPGRAMTVTARLGPGAVRVEVATVGSGWWPAGDGGGDVMYACALRIVAGVADRFGHFGVSGGEAVLWAEIAAGN